MVMVAVIMVVMGCPSAALLVTVVTTTLDTSEAVEVGEAWRDVPIEELVASVSEPLGGGGIRVVRTCEGVGLPRLGLAIVGVWLVIPLEILIRTDVAPPE